MKYLEIIICLFAAIAGSSCRQNGGSLFSSQQGRVVAVVGERRLYGDDIVAAIPSNLIAEDSIAFAELYVDRWVKHQIKVSEAERIFSSSFSEIEQLVENYRNSLLSQKLNQYYLNTTASIPFSDEDVKLYYVENREHFRLTRAVVKGVILRIPATHDSRTAITTMMKSRSAETRMDLVSMCSKSPELLFEDFTQHWIDYSDLMARLPVVKGDADLYMKRKGVQSLKDDDYIYMFEIDEYINVGGVKPLELVETQIRQLLTKEFHNEIINIRERELYNSAMGSEHVKIYN